MKKVLAALLAVLMIATMLPITAVAQATVPVTLTVSTEAKNAKIGEEVTFTVTMGPVTELPMQGMSFELSIPKGLTYVSGSGKVSSGLQNTFGSYETSFTEGKLIFVSVGGGRYTSNSEIVLMTFKCKVTGEVDKASVEVTLKNNDVIGPVESNGNIDTIPSTVVGCKLFLGDFLPGDANGDGEVDLRDAVRVTQYYNGWDVEINLAAADANGDGEIDLRDAVRITQYYNGWDVTLG